MPSTCYANGAYAAACKAYAAHEVPDEFATEAQLAAEGLLPYSEEIERYEREVVVLQGWLVEAAGHGAIRHTPLYRRGSAVDLRLDVGPDHTTLDSLVLEIHQWTRDVSSLDRVVALAAADCCGRVLESAVMDLSGRLHERVLLAAAEGAICTVCRAPSDGLPLEEFGTRLLRAMDTNTGLIIWGLADALLLEQTIAPIRDSPLVKDKHRLLSIDFADMQQWAAMGRGEADSSTTFGWHYRNLPSDLDAVERCHAMIEVFSGLADAERLRSLPPGGTLLADPVGPIVPYGQVVLPHEFALRTDVPSLRRTRKVPVQRRRTAASAWRTGPAERRLETREAALVEAFATHLQGLGHQVVRHKLTHDEGAPLWTDLYDTTTGVLYEAKADCGRDAIRYAIGQLLDYQSFFTEPPRLAVLLPGPPTASYRALLDSLGIAVVHRDGETFSARGDRDILHALESPA